MVSCFNTVGMFPPGANRHAPHGGQTSYFAYGYPQQAAAAGYSPSPNMNMTDLSMQQFPSSLQQFGAGDPIHYSHHSHHHQGPSIAPWANPSVYNMPSPLSHPNTCGNRSGPGYDDWTGACAEQPRSPHSLSPCSQHIPTSPSSQQQQPGSPNTMYPYKLAGEYPTCSQPQDLSNSPGETPSNMQVPTSTMSTIASVTASTTATAGPGHHSPDSGLGVSSDAVSSSESPNHDNTVPSSGQQPPVPSNSTTTLLPPTSLMGHHPIHHHPLVGLTSHHPAHHPALSHQTHQHVHHVHSPATPTIIGARSPNDSRLTYEWMKKPSYQSQPNPDMCPGQPYAWEDDGRPTRKTRTKDKYRVVYTDHQRLELEKEFHFSRYITIRRKSELAANLGLSERQVKIWFQNRRAKERKQVKKREEQMHKEKLDKMDSNAVKMHAVAAAAALHHGANHGLSKSFMDMKPIVGLE